MSRYRTLFNDGHRPLGPAARGLMAFLLALLLGGSLLACASGSDRNMPAAGAVPTAFNGEDPDARSAEIPADAAFLPEGVNQSCNASDGQSPVLLIHGTFANARRAFSTLTPLLRNEGFCVFALNYGKRSAIPSVYATGDMDQSADEIARFIDEILVRTGARQIDLVGHSQGGTLALHLGKRLGPAGKIRHIAAISPSTRGTLTAKALPGETRCTACLQQAPQSEFIRRLHEGPVNPAGLPTLILATENDVVVTPLQSQFVDEPRILNFRLQELFPGRRATHSGILRQPDAMQWVARWLRLGQPPFDRAQGL